MNVAHCGLDSLVRSITAVRPRQAKVDFGRVHGHQYVASSRGGRMIASGIHAYGGRPPGALSNVGSASMNNRSAGDSPSGLGHCRVPYKSDTQLQHAQKEE